MGKFIGEVAPIYGKWHWPLKGMKEGDWFVVDHELVNEIIKRCYPTLDKRNLPWTAIDPGKVYVTPAVRESEPKQSLYIVTMLDDTWKFAIELLPDRIITHGLELSETM